MQHLEQRSNLPADLPILQWLGRSENKEVIIASLRYEVIPAHSVFQSKGEQVKRCMLIVEGKVLQCDQFQKKTASEEEAEAADSLKQQEQKSEDSLAADDKDNYLIRPLDRSSCIVLCAWELCENKPSQFMLRTGEVPCKIGFFNSQVFTTFLLPRLKNTLSNKAILLENFILFRDISYASRLRIAEIFTFSLHPQGEFIFQENQSCTERIVFFLQQGDYSVCKKLRKFQETPSHLQQQQKQLPSTLQKIICLSEGEMIGLVNGNSFQFSLKSETECKVGRVSFEALKWMLRLWAIGCDEDLAKQLKLTMNRILQKAESVQQQFYLQNQFRFENRQASEAKLARESFVSQVKDLFMSKVQQHSQKRIEEEDQPHDLEISNQNLENSSTSSPKNSSTLTSPKRQHQSTNLIRQNDSLIILQKISSNQQYNGVNSPCSKELPNLQPFSVKDMAIGHLNLFDQTPSHSGQNKQQSSSSSLSQMLQQQQQERRSFSLQHRSSISSYASNTPSSLATPKTILYDPRKASVFSSALPQINRISGDMTDTNKDITTTNKSVQNKSTRFHSFSTAFNNSNNSYLSNGYSTGNHKNISSNSSANLLQNTTVIAATPANTKSSYFSQIQNNPKPPIQPFQSPSISNLSVSKSFNNLHPSSPTKEHNRSSRDLSLNSINQQLIPDQSSSVNELSKHETRTSFTSSAAVLSDLKNRRITAQGKASIFPANDILKPNNRYSFLSTSSPSKQKDILKASSNNNTLNTTNLENRNNNYSNISVFLNNTQLSTAHPLNHLKMKVEMEQLVKEKEMILTNLQERQKKNNQMKKNLLQPSGFQQELGRKPSSSAHVLQTSPHHKNLVKKAVQDLEDSAYFSLDFATDTHYRRGFLAKLSAKIANY